MQAMSKLGITIVGTVLMAGICGTAIAADTTPVLDAVNVSFELLNRDGEVVREADFQGKNVLLAFGFTHCLHICPLIAANMASALKLAEPAAVGVFISVDTERDSAVIVDDYAHGFSDQMMGLSGSYEQVSAAANNFKATFVVTKTADSYTVQHTPSIFLIGPDGKLIDVFAMNTASQVIADAMQ
jgi:protein SCO1/2